MKAALRARARRTSSPAAIASAEPSVSLQVPLGPRGLVASRDPAVRPWRVGQGVAALPDLLGAEHARGCAASWRAGSLLCRERGDTGIGVAREQAGAWPRRSPASPHCRADRNSGSAASTSPAGRQQAGVVEPGAEIAAPRRSGGTRRGRSAGSRRDAPALLEAARQQVHRARVAVAGGAAVAVDGRPRGRARRRGRRRACWRSCTRPSRSPAPPPAGTTAPRRRGRRPRPSRSRGSGRPCSWPPVIRPAAARRNQPRARSGSLRDAGAVEQHLAQAHLRLRHCRRAPRSPARARSAPDRRTAGGAGTAYPSGRRRAHAQVVGLGRRPRLPSGRRRDLAALIRRCPRRELHRAARRPGCTWFSDAEV